MEIRSRCPLVRASRSARTLPSLARSEKQLAAKATLFALPVSHAPYIKHT